MAKIQFEISNLKSFNKALQEAINKDNLVKEYITRGTMKVHKTAVEGIQGPPKTGKGYPRGSKTHIASAPGQYPATDQGDLASGITWSVEGNSERGEVVGKIVSSMDYSMALEFGTRNMEPRPFMQPSLEKNKRYMEKLFKEGIVKKKYKKGSGSK